MQDILLQILQQEYEWASFINNEQQPKNPAVTPAYM